jgi:transposase-like protein
MIMKNKYCYRSRISEAKFREIIKYFALDIEATKIAILTNVDRKTINKYLRMIRERMVEECERQSPLQGEVEVDESYFGPKRVRGKRGRGAGKKTPVFGLLKRNGKVYTKIIQEADRYTLHSIIEGKVNKDSIIHSDGWRGYDGLVDVGYRKHHRVHHGKNEFARGKSHINGIENFWGIAKVRLSKLRGIHQSTFNLHLKECEFRFNHRKENLYNVLLKLLKKHPLKSS